MPAPKGNKYGKNGGRPSDYTKEKAEAICREIVCSSTSLKNICKKLRLEYGTVRRWLFEKEEFRDLYANAKEAQADHMADEIHEATEEAVRLSKKGINSFRLSGFVQAMRLRVDSLKWTAAKLKPKKYGDKMDLTSDGQKMSNLVQIVMPDNGRDKTK